MPLLGRGKAAPPVIFADKNSQTTTSSIKETNSNLPTPIQPVRGSLKLASAHLGDRDFPSSKGGQSGSPKLNPSSAATEEKLSSQSLAFAKAQAEDSTAYRGQRVDSANNSAQDCSPCPPGAHRGRQDHARSSHYSPYPINRGNSSQDRHRPPGSEGSRRGVRHDPARPPPSEDDEVRGILRKETVLKDVHRAKMKRLREEIDTKVEFERTLFDMRRRASSTGRGPSDELLTGRLSSGK